VTAAEAALAEEMNRSARNRSRREELAEAKNEIVADALRQRETFSGRAFALGEALVRTGDPRHPDKKLEAVQQVTAADVQRVARKYLAQNSRVDIRYVNEKERPQGQTGDSWTNPAPLPTFKSVPPAVRPANALAPEGQRQQPPAPGTAVPVTPPAIAEAKLPNGLTLVTAKTGNIPLATMTIAMKGGASADPKGKAGLATLAADLATKGTTTRNAQQIAAELESLGASISSGAGPDGVSSRCRHRREPRGGWAACWWTSSRTRRSRPRKSSASASARPTQLSVALKDPGRWLRWRCSRPSMAPLPYGSLSGGTIASLKGADPRRHRAAVSDVVASRPMRPWSWRAASSPRLRRRWCSASSPAGKARAARPVAPATRAGQARKPRTIVIDLPGAGQAAVVAAVRGIDRADPDYYNLLVANAVLGIGIERAACSRKCGRSVRSATARTAICRPAPTMRCSPRPRRRRMRAPPTSRRSSSTNWTGSAASR
jgi:zinc protease